jgi:hypothetical protein
VRTGLFDLGQRETKALRLGQLLQLQIWTDKGAEQANIPTPPVQAQRCRRTTGTTPDTLIKGALLTALPLRDTEHALHQFIQIVSELQPAPLHVSDDDHRINQTRL